ncbi:MAG: hypothetical protein J0I65_17645 [Variovorax sp.]|nr:hypothetical protein [Variovorax sp.]
MAWLARHAADQGCHRIDWPVKATNLRGIAFYEGLGARRVADRLSYRLVGPGRRRLSAGRPLVGAQLGTLGRCSAQSLLPSGSRT